LDLGVDDGPGRERVDQDPYVDAWMPSDTRVSALCDLTIAQKHLDEQATRIAELEHRARLVVDDRLHEQRVRLARIAELEAALIAAKSGGVGT